MLSIVLQRAAGKPRLKNRDRALWIVLSRFWKDWRSPLAIVRPETVIRWHRRGFRLYWRWKCRPRWPGRKVEAFPWDSAPKYLLRDRDGIYGEKFNRRVTSMGIEQVLTAARSPWQNPYVERLIGSIRRECLDHTIILGEHHLRRVLKEYFRYYQVSRTHLGLEKDCPDSRPVEPPVFGPINAEPMVGGLHHRYFRKAA